MMTVSGLEMFTMERMLASCAYSSGTKLRTKGVMVSIVNCERLCTKMAVEDALVVLAISWTTPGAVSCRFTLVMVTSSGGLRLVVTASASVAKSSSSGKTPESLARITAGKTVTSIETVALYPSACCCMAARRRGRRRMIPAAGTVLYTAR